MVLIRGDLVIITTVISTHHLVHHYTNFAPLLVSASLIVDPYWLTSIWIVDWLPVGYLDSSL